MTALTELRQRAEAMGPFPKDFTYLNGQRAALLEAVAEVEEGIKKDESLQTP